MIGKIAGMLAENVRREKAHLEGRGFSEARMIKAAKDIPEVAKKLNGANGVTRIGAPQPLKAGVRMLDGKPMQFFSDGSLRHAAGKRVTKAARKQLKRARRAQKSA
jgi:hypothetical protein